MKKKINEEMKGNFVFFFLFVCGPCPFSRVVSRCVRYSITTLLLPPSSFLLLPSFALHPFFSVFP